MYAHIGHRILYTSLEYILPDWWAPKAHCESPKPVMRSHRDEVGPSSDPECVRAPVHASSQRRGAALQRVIAEVRDARHHVQCELLAIAPQRRVERFWQYRDGLVRRDRDPDLRRDRRVRREAHEADRELLRRLDEKALKRILRRGPGKQGGGVICS